MATIDKFAAIPYDKYLRLINNIDQRLTSPPPLSQRSTKDNQTGWGGSVGSTLGGDNKGNISRTSSPLPPPPPPPPGLPPTDPLLEGGGGGGGVESTSPIDWVSVWREL